MPKRLRACVRVRGINLTFPPNSIKMLDKIAYAQEQAASKQI